MRLDMHAYARNILSDGLQQSVAAVVRRRARGWAHSTRELKWLTDAVDRSPVRRRSAIRSAAGASKGSGRRSRAWRSPCRLGSPTRRPAPPPTATGEVTLGSNYSDEVPKAGGAGRGRCAPEQEPHGQDQHGRPQHIPGEHHHLPAEPGRRAHLVRRLPDALLRRPGPARRHHRCLGRGPERQLAEGFKVASTGDDGKQYFVPVPTTAGASTTARACSRRTAGPRRRPWTS